MGSKPLGGSPASPVRGGATGSRIQLADLAALQEWFVATITHPESAEAGVRASMALLASDDLERFVKPSSRESALERLEIYQRSYFARLIDCLADDYPALRFALGTEPFADLCRAYILAHPSREPNLNGFGRHFPDFLRNRTEASHCFATDLARLEWALVEAVHAPESEPFSEDALRWIPPAELPTVRFTASRSARVLSFDYPVNRYLQAFLKEQNPVQTGPEPSVVVVVRSAYKIWRVDLETAQAGVLRRLLAGDPLGIALEGVTADPADVRKWFRDWTSVGMFEGVRAGG